MTRTVGVEEEFLLVEPASSGLRPVGEAVVQATERTSDGQFEHEFKQEQAELATAPHESMTDLAGQLRTRRAELANGARLHGARLAALGTNPRQTAHSGVNDRRYARMGQLFGHVARVQLSCGMHVHVAIGSAEEGVAVLDRIRPWLPILLALSANSPYWNSEDTGYASYRSILWGQWPTAGVTDAFGDVAGYDKVREQLVASGAAIDDGMIYFDARLSLRYPTVEIRVADVSPFVEDAVLIAALARAMVQTAAADQDSGRPPPQVRTELMRAASWRAARWGVDGDLLDLTGPEPVPLGAGALIGRLIDWIGPALASTGDADLVDSGIRTILARSTGARLQRAAYAAAGSFDDVVDAIVAQTVPESL